MASVSLPYRSAVLRLAVALLLAVAGTRIAAAQVVNAPPALPVVMGALPSSDAIEASGFVDGQPVDIQLIRNGVVISSIVGATSVGGVLNVNSAPPSVCWAGVTPDIRPGDIIQFITQAGGGSPGVINQTAVMPITAGRPVVVQNDNPATPGGEGIVEVHGTASDLNLAAIPVANIECRLVVTGRFALNGRKTLRAGGTTTDGTFTYDTLNNPTGLNWTARFSNLVAGDVSLAVGCEVRAMWLGVVPANANQFSIYQNGAVGIPGPLAGVCTAPLEPLDVTPPSAPPTLTSTVTGPASRSFTWGTSTDNIAVAGYEFRRDGVTLARLGPLATTFADAAIPVGPHTYTVVAFDNASPRGAGATPVAQIQAAFGQLWGNNSADSPALAIVQADIVPPTTPATLTVARGNGKAIPTWSLATDNVGVVSYELFRNNVLLVTLPSPTTTYKDSGLVTGTYNYSVDAVDAAGLRSPRTANVAVNVVFVPDTTPPTTPGSSAATVTPDLHGRTAVVSWGAATDSMGVTGYTLYRNGIQRAVLGPNTLNFGDSALATATYVYQVDAFDAANNHSVKSAAATVVIANDPPLAPHVLVAHPSRDGVSATGYPAASGPYVVTVLRGATTFTSTPLSVDGTGVLQVNGASGGCWIGTTPNLRAGDVVRITDAAGIAEQTTIANVTALFAAGTSASSVVVHGTAQDAAGNPLPLSQIEHRLVAATGAFDKSASSTLRASSAAGADGLLAYDAPGSTLWTATYTGLSAADMARATGSAANAPAESRTLWLGRTPAAGTEQSMIETGPAVAGGPAAGNCTAPAEAPAAAASLTPAGLAFGDVSAIPQATSPSRTVVVTNTGTATMKVSAVYIAGLHATDYAISSPPAPPTLAPGAFFTIDVTFTPGALGARRGLLCVSCDAGNTTALTVALSGNGVTDVTPPTVPTGVTTAVGPDVHGHDVTVSWQAATDSVGVTGYTVSRDGAAIATTNAATLSYLDAGVAPATHVYRVVAFDLQNNRSAPSTGASAVIANEPPVAGHVLIAHPSRDEVTAAGYAAVNGPFVISVIRGNSNGNGNGIKVFTATPTNADITGLLQVNGTSGGCWIGNTPELRAGDVVRITDAAGIADQTTIADIVAEPAVAADSATVVVHGTAQDATGAPLPLAQIEHHLVSAAGTFDRNNTVTLRAGTAAGPDGSLAYDAPGSIHWTATYAGLSAADVARTTGGTDTPAGTIPAAESQVIWLGRQPVAGTEFTMFENGPNVMGGPVTPRCGAPLEVATAAIAALPATVQFERQQLSTSSAGNPRPIVVRNSGTVPMRIRGIHVTGLNAADFSIISCDAPSVLAPGASCIVNVAFAPSALGARQAALSFTCDATLSPATNLPLTGTGWNGLVIVPPGGPAANLGVGTCISAAAAGQRTIPVNVSWGASRTPLVTRYDLQQSVNGGPFVDAAMQPGGALGVTLQLPLSPAGQPAAYRFRVRAAGAGETSGWVTGTEFSLSPVDDADAGRVTLTGAWLGSTTPDQWAGAARSTTGKAGAELRAATPFAIPGSIAWITCMGPDRGKVSVRVDDRDSVIVDLYSDTLRVAAVGYLAPNLAAGRAHNMVVHALGKKNVLSSSARVDVDAFIVVDAVRRSGPVTVTQLPSGLTAQLPDAPATLSFGRVTPNPAMGHATLTFGLPREGAVRLDVMDVQGRLVRQLADGVLPAGEHHITWDGRTTAAQSAGSGVYFAVLRFGDQTLVRRLTWMP